MKFPAFLRPGKLNASDFGLLRWVVICLLVLVTVLVLMQTGVLYEIELEQVRFLGGSPFFISAEEVADVQRSTEVVAVHGKDHTLNAFTALEQITVVFHFRIFL